MEMKDGKLLLELKDFAMMDVICLVGWMFAALMKIPQLAVMMATGVTVATILGLVLFIYRR